VYRVIREEHGQRTVVMGGILTHAFALKMASEKRQRDPKRGVTYVVTRDVSAPATPRNGHGKRPAQPTGGRPLTRAERLEQGQRRKPKLPAVWGLDDHQGDIALVPRAAGELGLGMPAQANKGRRHRKGVYIPQRRRCSPQPAWEDAT
jgi:hypothetical protein